MKVELSSESRQLIFTELRFFFYSILKSEKNTFAVALLLRKCVQKSLLVRRMLGSILKNRNTSLLSNINNILLYFSVIYLSDS